MGQRWTDQDLSCSVIDVLNEVRQDILDGHFDVKTWDHKSDVYITGRSNKQLKIAGSLLLNDPDCTWEEARDAVLQTVVGGHL